MSKAFDPNPQDYNTNLVCDCPLPDNITGGECQPGYYCAQGSHEPTPCEEGSVCAAFNFCYTCLSIW